MIARTLVTSSRSLWDTNRRDEAKNALDEALGLLKPLGASADLARTHFYLAYFWMNSRRFGPASDHGVAALEMAQQVDSDLLAARALHVIGDTELLTGDAERGVELLTEAYRQLDELENLRRVHISVDLGICGCEARIYDIAAESLDRAEEFAQRLDSDVVVAFVWAGRARIALETGQWDAAAAAIRRVQSDREGGATMAPVIALGALGRLRVRRGDPAGREALEEALTVGEGWFWPELWPALCGLAELAWLEGRAEQIPQILEWVFEEALQSDSPWARGELGYWMWRAGAIEGPPDGAALPFALEMSGDWRAAAAEWRRLGCPYEEALALGEGDVEALLESVEIFDRLGARPAASWARSRLRDAGVVKVPRGPRPTTRTHPAGLTARQAEVLAVMIEGLSNAEIADRLFISPKTVEHHVSAIFAKLGVATRGQAVAQAVAKMREEWE